MLHSLTHRRDYETFSVSPENPTGEKGRYGGNGKRIRRGTGGPFSIRPVA